MKKVKKLQDGRESIWDWQMLIQVISMTSMVVDMLEITGEIAQRSW